MQLFRTQALEHQNRLHGEVFLVPPLRWQAIGWLLFIAVAVGLLVLAFGTHSRAVEAAGVIAPAPHQSDAKTSVRRDSDELTAILLVPASQIAAIDVGQKARISIEGFPTRDFGALDGKVVHVATKPANDADLRFAVRIALASPTAEQRENGLMLRNNWPVEGRVIIQTQSVLEWLTTPKPAGSSR